MTIGHFRRAIGNAEKVVEVRHHGVFESGTLTFQRVDAIIFDHMCASAFLAVFLGEDEF